MRPHGRAQIDPRAPRALAVCDRCQFMFNHDMLRWQMRWRGPKLQNIRLLVCESCYDIPNEQERLIVLPVDPVPINNARPENYANADNPFSTIGFDPADNFIPQGVTTGFHFGTLTQNAGLNAPFLQGPLNLQSSGTGAFTVVTAPLFNRPFVQSAALSPSLNGFHNWIAKDWNADPSGVTTHPVGVSGPIRYVATSFTAYAPNDMPFLRSGATTWQFQGTDDGALMVLLAQGVTAGTVGETVTATLTSGTAFSHHVFRLEGDGVSDVAVAGLVISISNVPTSEI